MLSFRTKIGENDPKKALEKAGHVVNKGLIGWLVRLFMGRAFVEQVNTMIHAGDQAVDSIQTTKAVMSQGMTATAQVLSIQDTGATVNMNPILILGLKIIPESGAEFQTVSRLVVPRISLPRVGDVIPIKYNPADPSQTAML